MKKKITIRVSDEVSLFLSRQAKLQQCSVTKVAEKLVTDAAKRPGRDPVDCALEVGVNAAAAVQELARMIITDQDGYEQYRQAVVERTRSGLIKYRKQIKHG